MVTWNLFQVRRYTGSLGFVTLQWSMFCPSGELNTSSLGFLDFSSNQTSNQLIFKITNNGQPSLKSFCFVELLNASQVCAARIDFVNIVAFIARM